MSIEIYSGPSELDGAPILGIASGLDGSTNSKTGDMVQVYIIRSDIDPIEASRSGADASVCGSCTHRHGSNGRSCYVQLQNAPLSLYRAYHRGRILPGAIPPGRVIRLGAYGDPAALPDSILRSTLKGSIGHTGYTHQWRDITARRAWFISTILMASVDSIEERDLARSRGWRTFRIRSGADSLDSLEISCPASAESGYRVTCAECLLCSGRNEPRDSRKDITIIGHGGAAARSAFEKKWTV